MGCNLGVFTQGLEGRQPRDREVRALGQISGDLRELADPAQYGFWRLLYPGPLSSLGDYNRDGAPPHTSMPVSVESSRPYYDPCAASRTAISAGRLACCSS
jgi:hypothetical protein